MGTPNYFYGELTRGALQNLETAEFMEFLMNPEELRARITVNYARQPTHGGSHHWLQYQNTSNATFPLTLIFPRHVLISSERDGAGRLTTGQIAGIQDKFEDYRKFLLALCYPVGQRNAPMRRSPPPALLLWPSHVAIKVVLTSLEFRDPIFDQKQRSMEIRAQCEFEEYRQYRLTSSDARQKGFMRARATTR